MLGVALAAVLGLMSVGCGGEGGSNEADDGLQVMDSAGVRVVVDAAPDRPAPWSLTPVRELAPPDSALVPVPWGVAASLDGRRIWAVDWIGERVVAFDGSGEFVDQVGRHGEGPGELMNPVAVAVGPEGDLRVWDAGRGMISRWTAAGELVDEVRAPVPYWGPGMHVYGGGVVTVTSEGSELSLEQRLVDAAPGASPTLLHAVSRELAMAELPCGARPFPHLFAPDVVWAARGDTLRVLKGPGYRIDGLAGGVVVESFRRPVEPLVVTESMAVRRAGVGEFRMVIRMCGVTAEQVVQALGWEETISPVSGLTLDPEGRLWVSRASRALVPEAADVLAPDGRYLGTVAVPGIPVAFPSSTRMVVLSYRPETELPVLTLHDLVPVGG